MLRLFKSPEIRRTKKFEKAWARSPPYGPFFSRTQSPAMSHFFDETPVKNREKLRPSAALGAQLSCTHMPGRETFSYPRGTLWKSGWFRPSLLNSQRKWREFTAPGRITFTFCAAALAAEKTPAIWSMGTRESPVYCERPLMPFVNLELDANWGGTGKELDWTWDNLAWLGMTCLLFVPCLRHLHATETKPDPWTDVHLQAACLRGTQTNSPPAHIQLLAVLRGRCSHAHMAR